MTRLLVSATCLALVAGLLGACGAAPPSVAICHKGECGKAEIEVPITGPRAEVPLVAQANPANVSFTWSVSGSGGRIPREQITLPGVVFEADAPANGSRTVLVDVLVTDPQTNLTARAHVTLLLRAAEPPPSPVIETATAAPTPSRTAKPASELTRTATPEPVQEVDVNLTRFSGTNACSGEGSQSGTATLAVYEEGTLAIDGRLAGLQPDHLYVLTLNEQSPGLLQSVREFAQGHYDFAEVVTDEGGNLEVSERLKLPPETYLVKLLVKDPTGEPEYCVLLNDDTVNFTIS